MYDTNQATVEQIEAYAVALERELESYKARLNRVKNGGADRLEEDAEKVLNGRVREVEAELSRVKKDLGQSDTPKKRRGKAAEPVEEVDEVA